MSSQVEAALLLISFFLQFSTNREVKIRLNLTQKRIFNTGLFVGFLFQNITKSRILSLIETLLNHLPQAGGLPTRQLLTDCGIIFSDSRLGLGKTDTVGPHLLLGEGLAKFLIKC